MYITYRRSITVNLKVRNFISISDTSIVEVTIRNALNDLPEVANEIDDLAILICNKEKINDETVIEEIQQFLKYQSSFTTQDFHMMTTSTIGRRSVIRVAWEDFQTSDNELRDYVSRHELTHILLGHKANTEYKVNKDLYRMFPNIAERIVKIYKEHQVHIQMIQRFPLLTLKALKNDSSKLRNVNIKVANSIHPSLSREQIVDISLRYSSRILLTNSRLLALESCSKEIKKSQQYLDLERTHNEEISSYNVLYEQLKQHNSNLSSFSYLDSADFDSSSTLSRLCIEMAGYSII